MRWAACALVAVALAGVAVAGCGESPEERQMAHLESIARSADAAVAAGDVLTASMKLSTACLQRLNGDAVNMPALDKQAAVVIAAARKYPDEVVSEGPPPQTFRELVSESVDGLAPCLPTIAVKFGKAREDLRPASG